jgi:hypothetical protein
VTYEDAYRECKTLEEMTQILKTDLLWAELINKDRIPVIKEAFDKVANEKFKEAL